MSKIEKLYAFISATDGSDDEGIVAYKGRDGWYPLVTSDRNNIPGMEKVAQDISERSGVEIHMATFTRDVGDSNQ